MKTDFFFTTYYTECDHVEHVIRKWLESHKEQANRELLYYRKFKLGHVPCYREAKITNMSQFCGDQMMKEIGVSYGNFHKEMKEKRLAAYNKAVEAMRQPHICVECDKKFHIEDYEWEDDCPSSYLELDTCLPCLRKQRKEDLISRIDNNK